jgi:hypothetical protein
MGEFTYISTENSRQWTDGGAVRTALLPVEVIIGTGGDTLTAGVEDCSMAAGGYGYAEPGDKSGYEDVDTGDIGIEDGLGEVDDEGVDAGEAFHVHFFEDGELDGLNDDNDELARTAYKSLGIDPDAEHFEIPGMPIVAFIPVRDENGAWQPQYALDCQPPSEDSWLAESLQYYLDTVDKSRDQAHFDTEVPLTSDEEKIFACIVEGYEALADTLDVPESKERITQQKHVHMFAKQEDMINAVLASGANELDIEDAVGLCWVMGGVLWTRSEDIVDNASGLAHEVVHDWGVMHVAVQDIGMDGHRTISLKTGYADNKPGLNEFAADLIADRIVRPMLGDSTMGYSGLDAIGDAVIREVAGAADPQVVEDVLERGFLNGDPTAKLWIEGTLGKDTADMFFGMTGDESAEEALEIAREIGLPAAEQMIQDMLDGKKVTLFAWR